MTAVLLLGLHISCGWPSLNTVKASATYARPPYPVTQIAKKLLLFAAVGLIHCQLLRECFSEYIVHAAEGLDGSSWKAPALEMMTWPTPPGSFVSTETEYSVLTSNPEVLFQQFNSHGRTEH